MTTLALVHPTDLLSAELRESLDRRRDLWDRLYLFSTIDEEVGTLTDVRGAAAMVQQLEPGSLAEVDVAFFSGPIERNRELLGNLPENVSAIVLSPDAGPEDGYPIVAGVNLDAAAERDTPLLSPHPVTVMLAHVLHPLRELEPRQVVATILQPASALGQEALDEVFEQTRSILTFAPDQPREVFPIQMAFNVVPDVVPSHLEAHLRTVLDFDVPIAASRLQAGIFHSYGASLVVEIGRDADAAAVRERLNRHSYNDPSPDPELLGPVDAAARDEVLIGPVEAVAGRPGFFKLWVVMDNLTCGGAMNALHILEKIRLQHVVH